MQDISHSAALIWPSNCRIHACQKYASCKHESMPQTPADGSILAPVQRQCIKGCRLTWQSAAMVLDSMY